MHGSDNNAPLTLSWLAEELPELLTHKLLPRVNSVTRARAMLAETSKSFINLILRLDDVEGSQRVISKDGLTATITFWGNDGTRRDIIVLLPRSHSPLGYRPRLLQR